MSGNKGPDRIEDVVMKVRNGRLRMIGMYLNEMMENRDTAVVFTEMGCDVPVKGVQAMLRSILSSGFSEAKLDWLVMHMRELAGCKAGLLCLNLPSAVDLIEKCIRLVNSLLPKPVVVEAVQNTFHSSVNTYATARNKFDPLRSYSCKEASTVKKDNDHSGSRSSSENCFTFSSVTQKNEKGMISSSKEQESVHESKDVKCSGAAESCSVGSGVSDLTSDTGKVKKGKAVSKNEQGNQAVVVLPVTDNSVASCDNFDHTFVKKSNDEDINTSSYDERDVCEVLGVDYDIISKAAMSGHRDGSSADDTKFLTGSQETFFSDSSTWNDDVGSVTKSDILL